MSLKIHSATIQDFKNVAQAAFKAEGNHVILSGTNGSGKSAILEALLTALCGKIIMPDDPIRHGSESSLITVNLSEGKKIDYTITVIIKDNDFVLKIQPYDVNGTALSYIDKPQTFLKNLINKMAINPQSFFTLKPHEQVQELYKVMPELKDKIDKNQSDFDEIQSERSEILQEKKSIEGQLKTFANVSEYPDEELNSEELTAELVLINKHNAGQQAIISQMKANDNSIALTGNKISFIGQRISDLDKQIDDMESKLRTMKIQLDTQQKELNAQIILKTNCEIIKKEFAKDLENFQLKDEKGIKEKLSKSSAHNEKAKQKKIFYNLTQKLSEIENLASGKLVEMKVLQADKLNICRSAQMPIAGLAIGDDCLIYQFPGKTDFVELNSLSTGQKWVVALALNAKLNPNCKILFVESLNDLDQDNQVMLYTKAQESGIQLIMHNTAQTGDGSQCDIIIKDATIEQW
jgi:recombinational DNA repair ATPase RecF